VISGFEGKAREGRQHDEETVSGESDGGWARPKTVWNIRSARSSGDIKNAWGIESERVSNHKYEARSAA